MPVITKQAPPKPPPAKAGSILSRGKDLSLVKDDWVHMLLYGQNRIGKTTLMGQFPKPMALLSLENSQSGGARSIKRIPGITKFTWREELKTVDDIENLGHELKASGGFKSIGIDSGTSLDEIVLAKVCGWEETANMLRWGKVSQDQYTERSEIMRRILRPFTECAAHLVITANEKDHNSQEGKRNALVKGLHTESYFAAAMGGGTTRWTMDACDFICQLYMEKEVVIEREEIILPGSKKEKKIRETEVETGRHVRRLRLKRHPNFAAGIRGEDSTVIPDYIEAETPQEMFEQFMRVVRGEKISRLSMK